ncbi:tail fiber domain-containing protein [Citrobacter sp. MNAZ 1397]|uniref:tail fiber domain-containing protein n=1 Tax=Citrobacter sp. MNAZ 1397 TaxID=2911205 RepID=UPI00202743E3|nr:tail fiber domain-containing protein [Citrobacter sp. MNAZ 1397]MCL9671492.1 tail fiber domain-containing protein [Citrobacter sp. MNAZ 1397]
MIYTTGTIAISGNTLTGTGTNFTAAGSLIRVGCTLFTMANPVQVFQVTAINSATQLTVTPAASPAIAAGTAYAILLSDSLSVDGLAQNIAETLTLYQRNMSGFADVMNGAGDVTITTNGVAVTVPGQKALAKKGANNDITSLSGLTTPLSQGQGGTGLTSPFGAVAGSFCQGNDTRLSTIDAKSGGIVNGSVKASAVSPAATPTNGTATNAELIGSRFRSGVYAGIDFSAYAQVVQGNGSYGILQLAYGGTPAYWSFAQSGVATGVSWTPTCDERLKDLDGPVPEPLDKMRLMRGQSWRWKTNGNYGIGLTAQDVQRVFPDAVVETHDVTLPDGSVVKNVLSPDSYGVAAALHHEAILALMAQVDALTARVAELEPTKSEESETE